MKNIKEVIEAIFICLAVAHFLVTTSRALKAIELYKECLFILNDIAVIMEQKSATFLYKAIYWNMWQACCRINDNQNGIKYLAKIIRICRECGERSEEYKLNNELAKMYFHQSNYIEAKELWEKVLVISKQICDRETEAMCYGNLAVVYQSVAEHQRSREYLEKSLAITKEIGSRKGEAYCYVNLGNVLLLVGENKEARRHYEKSLPICKEIGDRKGEAFCYGKIGVVYYSVGEYQKAREYHEKSLAICKGIGARTEEAFCYENLGVLYRSIGEYQKAGQYHEKSLAIRKEIGDRNAEAASYGNLGNVYQSVCEYQKARKYYEKSLVIDKEIGDKHGEAICYGNLGSVYHTVSEYQKAREYHEKSLVITKEIGDRNGEGACYRNLGAVCVSVGEYHKAREYLEKSLGIKKEIGDRNEEAACYGNLGSVYESLGEYQKATEYHEKSLAIFKEIGNRNGEATCYGKLGAVNRSIGEYEKAREYHDKTLAIMKEIGDKNGEASCYRNLGAVYQSVGQYEKAIEYHEKSLAISREIGDVRNGEAASYGNLGSVYRTVGEYQKAEEYCEKALRIKTEIGDRQGQASSHYNIGSLFLSRDEYEKADEHFQKAIAIATEIGDKHLEAYSYGQKGVLLITIGDYVKAKDFLERALVISKSIFSREAEAEDCTNLGTVFCKLGEYVKAEEYIKKGLAISEEIGDVLTQFSSLEALASLRKEEGKIQEAISCCLPAIKNCEDLRSSLLDNDQFKISFSDCHIHTYQQLSALLCGSGKPNDALYVAELARASALTDLMSAHYAKEKQISANPDTWAGIEKVIGKERNSTCLYVSYFFDIVFLWIIKASGVTHFRKINGGELIAQEGLNGSLNDFFGSESFRSFGILPEELCEDRSLNFSEQETKSCMEDSLGDSLRMEEGQDKKGPKMNLPLCYKLIIAPVVDLLEGNEIIIVPDRSLYNIPFAALPDKKEKYLSETFWVRLVPSLTTLKLIHDSPADYHSETGALIVGNPDVGDVRFQTKKITIFRLPCAENEAKMIGKMLGVKPLLGQQATKQAVLELINSVSLIHLAAHGDAERGEIFLAPAHRTPGRRPREKDYLLTMSDISKVRLRAKLVVLSCCHSARGKIKAEGAVGIARALLGAGARSVLVSLWAVDDSATEKLMSHFYNCLVRGESASESLHNAMQRTRREGYSHVSQWTPFVLIGDNVTFDFEKQGFVVANNDAGDQIEL